MKILGVHNVEQKQKVESKELKQEFIGPNESVKVRLVSHGLIMSIYWFLKGKDYREYFSSRPEIVEELLGELLCEVNKEVFERFNDKQKRWFLIFSILHFKLNPSFDLLFETVNKAIAANWNAYENDSIFKTLVAHYSGQAQATLNECLYLAIAKGLNALVVLLLNLGAKDDPENRQNSALWVATFNNHPDLVALFLQGTPPPGFEECLKVAIGRSMDERYQGELNECLRIAAKKGYKAIVVMLLNAGAKDPQNAALREAIAKCHWDLVALFAKGTLPSDLEQGCLKVDMVPLTDEQLRVALREVIYSKSHYQHRMIQGGTNIEVYKPVKELVDIKREDIECLVPQDKNMLSGIDADADGNTLLFHAVLKQRLDIAEILLSCGADIDYVWTDQQGFRGTLLARMVKQLSFLENTNSLGSKQKAIKEVILFLLGNGANPENVGLNNSDILIKLDRTMANLLFNYYYIKAAKSYQQPPDEVISLLDWDNLLRILKEKMGVFSGSGNDATSQIIFLIMVLKLARKEEGAVIPDSRSFEQTKVLYLLHKVAEEILGIRVIGYSSASEEGQEMRPMSHGVVEAKPEFVEAAHDGKKETIARFFLLQGERLSRLSIINALYEAASQGHTKIVRMLLDKGHLTKAEINGIAQGASNRRIALDVAVAKGHLDIVKLLVKYGADINLRVEEDNLESKDDNESVFSFSPLQRAIEQDRREIIVFLLDSGAQIGDALQIALMDPSRRDLSQFLIEEMAKRKRMDELGSTLLGIVKNKELDASQRLNAVMLLLEQVELTREILNAIAANFDDQDLPNIFLYFKCPRHKEGALRAAIQYGRFLTAGYLISGTEGVNIDYLASGGKTLLENLIQQISTHLENSHYQSNEAIETSWKVKLMFLLKNGAHPKALYFSPKVLQLLDARVAVQLTYDYLLGQVAAAELDQEEKNEQDHQVLQEENSQMFKAQELRNILLSSLDNAKKSPSRFSLFEDKRPAPAVIEAMKKICEDENYSNDAQALQVLIKLAEKVGIEVKQPAKLENSGRYFHYVSLLRPRLPLETPEETSLPTQTNVVGAKGSLNTGLS
ncbi:MAG: ankyrin repeat protein 17-like [Gammaproteobacteria bacterium]|nr:ankyrin repeat protein 17-like [Gammaproteobacteria bacterium]